VSGAVRLHAQEIRAIPPVSSLLAGIQHTYECSGCTAPAGEDDDAANLQIECKASGELSHFPRHEDNRRFR
jgi:hypothetical protein